MNKEFWKSKTFWAGVGGIITSIGFVTSGEITVASFISESIPALIGVLTIVFRWSPDGTKLGLKK